jgi:hypothetical protein
VTAPTPLGIERLTESCEATHYGVPVSYLGEDAEDVAAFTTDRRRALAAMNKLHRESVGDPFAESYDPTTLHFRWVHVITHCGCVHPDPTSCSAETNGDVTCCPVVDADDEYAAQVDECDCPHYGLPPCSEDLYAWMTIPVSEGTPGAIPMFEVSQ